jgi:WD40 repeat protein
LAAAIVLLVGIGTTVLIRWQANRFAPRQPGNRNAATRIQTTLKTGKPVQIASTASFGENGIHLPNKINALTAGPATDGSLSLAAGCSDFTIRLFQVRTDRGEATFKVYVGHTARITALRFTPDHEYLVSADTFGNIRFWDLSKPPNNAQHLVLRGPKRIQEIVFSRDGSQFLASDGVAVHLWDVKRQRELQVYRERQAGTRLFAWSAERSQMIIAPGLTGGDGFLMATGTGGLTSIRFQEAEAVLATYGATRQIADRFLNEQTGPIVAWPSQLGVPQDEFGVSIERTAISGDRKVAVTVQARGISVWSLADGMELATIPGTDRATLGHVSQLVITGNGQYIATSTLENLQFWKLSELSSL